MRPTSILWFERLYLAAFALSLTGRDPFVYLGSWSQWSNTRGLPVAVGLTPSGAISPQLT